MSKTFFGFAVADGMFDGDCILSRTELTPDEAREICEAGVVPALNPSHKTTIEAMRNRFGIDVEVPEKAPHVTLFKGDSIIVMSVRGLPRLGGERAEYSQEEIDSATFKFARWQVLER